MDEIWKDIKGYEGFYKVSNMGNVRSIDRFYSAPYLRHSPVVFHRGIILKQHFNRYGYLAVNLNIYGNKKTITVHKLVAEAFIENFLNKPCIDHINGDRTDNKSENLRWVTNKENQNNPITKRRLSECKIGKNHPFFGKKFTKEHSQKIKMANKNGKLSIPVVQLSLDGKFIKEFPSTQEVQRQMGICHGNIWKAIKNSGVASGYKWMYKKDYIHI